MNSYKESFHLLRQRICILCESHVFRKFHFVENWKNVSPGNMFVRGVDQEPVRAQRSTAQSTHIVVSVLPERNLRMNYVIVFLVNKPKQQRDVK